MLVGALGSMCKKSFYLPFILTPSKLPLKRLQGYVMAVVSVQEDFLVAFYFDPFQVALKRVKGYVIAVFLFEYMQQKLLSVLLMKISMAGTRGDCCFVVGRSFLCYTYRWQQQE